MTDLPLTFFVIVLDAKGACYIAHVGLKLATFLPQFLKFWDHKCVPFQFHQSLSKLMNISACRKELS